MTRRDGVLLVLVGATWGAVYPLTSVALHELDPATVVFARTALAALALLPFALWSKVLGPVCARPLAILAAVLLQATIPLILLTVGQQHVAAGLAGILLASQAVWATILTAATHRTARRDEVAGVVLGLLGVATLFLRDLDLSGTSVWAATALLAAAVFYAAGTVYIQFVIPEVPPLATATAAMAVSTAVLAPFVITTAPHPPSLSTAGWLLVLGVVATGGALVAFYALIQRAGAIRANLVAYLAPGFAVAYGAAFLGERPSLIALLGLVLILLGSNIATRGSSPTAA